MNIKQFFKPNRIKIIVSTISSLVFLWLNFPFRHFSFEGGGCMQQPTGWLCTEPVPFFNLSFFILDILVGFAVSYLIVCLITRYRLKKLFLIIFIGSLVVTIILGFLVGVGEDFSFLMFKLSKSTMAISIYSLICLSLSIWSDKRKFFFLPYLGLTTAIILSTLFILLVWGVINISLGGIVAASFLSLLVAFICFLISVFLREKRVLWYFGYLALIFLMFILLMYFLDEGLHMLGIY